VRIKRLVLQNVKSFNEKTAIDFNEKSINAFSGVNGAGKSTLLKMIWLTQKVHYIRQSLVTNEMDLLQQELARFMSRKDSYFTLYFESELKIIEITLRKEKVDSNVEIEYSDETLANQMWNVVSPKNLILFVDASKGFSEDTLLFNEIDIAGNDATSLAFTAINNPSKLFAGIYRQLVKDWAHARLIPGKPDRLFYFQVASRLFNKLIPKVMLSNFSGSHTPKEFVLLGKTIQEGNAQAYDVREFSSGEKALLSTLTFLCISKSVSVFLIDEPENHFHESLLLQFISLLRDLCEPDGFVDVVQKIPRPKRAKSKKGDTGDADKSDEYASEGRLLDPSQLKAVYGGAALSQVIISTHSKSLIYNIFTHGQNILVDKKLLLMEYDNAEAVLRKIGLSTIYNKVLLVEGEGDSDALDNLFLDENVKIKQLNGSMAVIDSFKRLSSLDKYFLDSKFVFLVDSDNKPSGYFEKIEALNPDYYKKTFIKLPVHEFENLLLEPKFFEKIIQSYSEIIGKDAKKFTQEYIKSVIEENAKKSLPQVYKKELSLFFMQSVERHFSSLIWGDKKFKWDTAVGIEQQINTVLTSEQAEKLNLELVNKTKNVFENYIKIDGDELRKRCDGKQTLGMVCHQLGTEAGISAGDLRQGLYKYAKEDTTSEISKIVVDIKRRLAGG
jgi:hypothetical protein